MARKKVSKLIQAIQLFNELDANEQQHLADYIRSQQPPRMSSKRASKKKVATAADNKEVGQEQ